jgi:hypothetical protein
MRPLEEKYEREKIESLERKAERSRREVIKLSAGRAQLELFRTRILEARNLLPRESLAFCSVARSYAELVRIVEVSAAESFVREEEILAQIAETSHEIQQIRQALGLEEEPDHD